MKRHTHMAAGFDGLLVQFFLSDAGREISSTHTVYCKKHIVRRDDPATPSQRTLFSLGWPSYCSGNEVEAVFSRAGSVTATYLQHSAGSVREVCHDREGGKVTYVVFSQPEELNRALQMCVNGETVRCNIQVTGIRKWCAEYASARPVVDQLESTVGHIVGQYDMCKVEQEKLVRKRFSQPDSEGWVTVTRRKTHHQTRQQETHKKRKAKKLINFYQFQQRESQREAIAELRRKFHKDKEKVAALRASRKFKPF